MATYFISDTHFNHAKIIELSKRPFKDVDHMNEMMIKAWNETIKPEDIVIHLGDFAMGQKIHHKGFLDRLNGYKILVRGNHDQDYDKMLAMGFNEVCLTRLVELEGVRLYMRHIPPLELDPYAGRFYKTEFTPDPPPASEYDYFLCGHVHNAFRRKGNVINVGVDRWDFKPRTLQELLSAIDDPA